MHYEINVSLNGTHFFATAERSIENWFQLRKVYEVFKKKFPKSEGFQLTVSKYENTSEILTEKEIMS